MEYHILVEISVFYFNGYEWPPPRTRISLTFPSSPEAQPLGLSRGIVYSPGS